MIPTVPPASNAAVPTASPTASGAANPCDTCSACCRSYAVPLCGHDVWQISARQRLSPEQFVLLYPEQEPRPEAFQLEAGGQPYTLVLDKKGRFALKSACVFLVELPGGHARCGVYGHRPVVCQSYPMSMWSRVVRPRRETLCPPDSWPPAAVTNPRWAAALQRLCLHQDIYCEVVTRWNARVAAHPERGFALMEFFSFLLNVYQRLDAIRQELGEEGMARVEASWPTFPRPPYDSHEALSGAGGQPWLSYFLRVRRVLDAFYPEVPPQPPSLRPTPPAPPDAAPQPVERPAAPDPLAALPPVVVPV
ncbi:MAG: hypothetical protein AVDCRST_MAG77-2798 [uncultured Chloroflexi bacterium]|uniref:YkgJ family cysteine cluster protein n=1 Tax=uncultured Chloroflexota bacterium TaxID=166587 RepID=A0A6J4J1G9_9CHLR|nr:MAG: hypothetical protein AVDCRST_MAG77-2798 [uncultured Chloroflexota bacterium]